MQIITVLNSGFVCPVHNKKKAVESTKLASVYFSFEIMLGKLILVDRGKFVLRKYKSKYDTILCW